MGSSEDGNTSKSDKSSSPAPPDQGNVHVYPDWAAMQQQAYYGHGVAIPTYYNSAVASGHPPQPYTMWAPPQQFQHVMPPYGAPYPAFYSHGGLYAHHVVPLGSHSHGQGVPTSPAAITPLSTEGPAKSSGNTDRGLMKKLKGYDGLAMSIGNVNGESAEGGTEHRPSQSETEGSSDGSNGNTAKADQTGRKRSREGTPTVDGDGKTEKKSCPVPAGKVKAASDNVLGVGVAPSGISGKSAGPVLSPPMSTALELKNPPGFHAKTSPTSSVPQPCAVLHPETWPQNDREVKRERRKQSNRESARRSRLRKQAETEELARKVDAFTAENVALKSELNQLAEKSEKLRLENATLMEKLKNAHLGHTQEIVLKNSEDKRVVPASTENLLSRVNNSGSVDRKTGEDGRLFESAKLHQLLGRNGRADAVAAS